MFFELFTAAGDRCQILHDLLKNLKKYTLKLSSWEIRKRRIYSMISSSLVNSSFKGINYTPELLMYVCQVLGTCPTPWSQIRVGAILCGGEVPLDTLHEVG